MSSVSKLTPWDTTGVKDQGVRAVISLAVSLGWNVVLKPGNPCTLIAKDGARLRMPTDTTVKDSVFQGYLSTVMTHSQEFTPTVQLMDSIIATHKKLSDSHQTRLRMAVGESAKQHRERMAAMNEGAKEIAQGDHLTQRIEIPELLVTKTGKVLTDDDIQALADEAERGYDVSHLKEQSMGTQPVGTEAPHIVSEQPFIARNTTGWSYESPGVIVREWSDGHKDFRCMDCTYVHTSPAGIGGHRKVHGRLRPQIPVHSDRNKRIDVDTPPTIIHKPKEVLVEAEGSMPDIEDVRNDGKTAAEIIDQIRFLVAQPLVQANSDLAAENAQLRAENKKLKDDWAALQSLLNPGR